MSNLNWLYEPNPHLAMAALQKSGALAEFLPEVSALYGVPQSPEYHPEVDTGIHIEMCLEVADRMQLSPAAKFAVLVHDLGKAHTPVDLLPKHHMHEKNGLTPVQAVCDRLWISRYTTDLALLVCEHHLSSHRILEARATTVVQFVFDTGLEFNPTLLADFVASCEADKRGRLGMHDKEYLQGKLLREVCSILQAHPLPTGITAQSGTTESQAFHRARIGAVRPLMHKYLQAAGV